jgi:hypothetical protein
MTMILVLSLFAIFTCGHRIVAMYFFTADFTVENLYKVCEQPLNNRCVTHYAIRLSDGSLNDFVPFGTEFEHNDLYDGVHIVKRDRGFEYEIGGLPKPWPNLQEQGFLFLAGIGGLLLWWKLNGLGYIRMWLEDPWRRDWR